VALVDPGWDRHPKLPLAMDAPLAAALAASGKPLPLNVDGAIAAVLADLGFAAELANGFFILARTAGWMAHVDEELAREKPMRRIDQQACAYDGPAPRGLPNR
jgi:citrate synthase